MRKERGKELERRGGMQIVPACDSRSTRAGYDRTNRYRLIGAASPPCLGQRQMYDGKGVEETKR